MFLRSEYDVASKNERAPSAVLRALNARLSRFLSRFAMRFTALCATLDLTTGELRWSSGGHPPPCVVRDGRVIELDSGGPFLGLLADLEFPEWGHTLAPGDTVCILTDGLTEALDGRGKPIGEQRVYEIIEEAARAGAPLAAAVLRAVRGFAGTLQDDATLVAARWQPAA
jgi:serine phosphatase RsbU (regulator of sigma subunit)